MVRILADTNVLLREIDRGHEQYGLSRGSVRKILERGDTLCVTSQNLIEFWAVCTRPVSTNGLGLRPDQADRALSRVEATVVRLSEETSSVYLEWRRLVTGCRVSGKKCHDARLVAAMIVHNITCILTFNVQDFERYPGITPIHPATV